MITTATRSAALALAVGLVAACAMFRREAPVAHAPPPPPPPPVASSEPKEIAPAGLPAPEPAPQAEIYPGTGRLAGPRPLHERAETTVGEGGDITLNFINADVKDVAKAVLGDYLKLNYEIGANVQGNVTIQTSQPLKRSQVLPVLQQALKLNGIALVFSSGIYKVVPLADARSEGGAIASREGGTPGYGTDAIPVHYISAAEMAKLLEPLAPAQGIIHVDSTHNLLIVEGTEQERQTIRDDVALFDSDWLSGMSYAIYSPTYTDATELTKELDEILGGANSPIHGVVKLVPIERLNAILAVSPQQRYLEQLRAWVKRLDRPGQGTDRRVFVYHVQNGRAADLARTLSRVLFGGNPQTIGEDSGPPPAPFSNEPGTPPPMNMPQNQPGALQPGPPPGNVPPVQPPSAQGAAGPGAGVSATGLGNIGITADETNNALVILASPQQYASVEAALKELDASPLQVFLEAAIAEVTLTNDLKFGVQYFYQPDSRNQIVLTDTASTAIAPILPGFSYMFSRASNIKIILNTLSTLTHIEVVSAPQGLVINTQTATLQVGDRVPIATAEAVSTITSTAPIVNSIEYEDTGVILKVTPRVNRGGLVLMDISQEVSQVSSTTTSSLNSPTIQQRKINSSVAIQDGETVALGGLISDSKEKDKSGIPFLEEIPILGNLFATTTHTTKRTELMVLITPHVVQRTEDARAVTAELRRKLPEVEPVLERAR
jgi:general secretion pathway protein D